MLFYNARESEEQKPRPCLALVQDGWMDEKEKKKYGVAGWFKSKSTYVAAKRE